MPSYACCQRGRCAGRYRGNMSELRYETFTVAGENGSQDERGAAFIRAIDYGFLDHNRTDDLVVRQLDRFRNDRTVLTEVFDDDQPAVAVPGTVATFGDFVGTVSVGDGTHGLAAQMVTEVTVRGTHRRRGILTRMMTDALFRAKQSGLALSALTASEGGIYGRFGFGVAAFSQHVTIDARRGLALRPDVSAALAESGITVIVPSWDAFAAAYPALQESFAQVTPGQTGHTHAYRRRAHGDANPRAVLGWEKSWRPLLALDESGTPIGYALTTVTNEHPDIELTVEDLGANTLLAEIALWESLAATDLVTKLEWAEAALDFALPGALIDPRAITFGRRFDHLWLRVLDVIAAFEARGLQAQGSVTLRVSDSAGMIDGDWTINHEDGGTTVSTGADAELYAELDAETLGSLYLGTLRVRDLVATGRIKTNDEGALARLFDTAKAPRNTYTF